MRFNCCAAGIATSSVGAATNIGASLAEKILNSRQVREMNVAFARDKEPSSLLLPTQSSRMHRLH